jgi:uncharacterized OB-fold protein
VNDQAAPVDWSQGLPLTAGEYFIGIYQPSPETVGYWEGVTRHELMLKWCPHCSKAFHPKRIVCTDCGASDLGWKRASGKGQIYSFSEIHHAPSEVFAKSVPYTVGLVELEEGVHLFSRLIPQPEPAKIGSPVKVAFRVLELGKLLPVFLIGAS